MRPLSLAHLTVLDLAPPQMIHTVAEIGFASVGLRLIAVNDTTPGYSLMDNPQMLRDTIKAMRETGVRVNDIEFVRVTPTFNAAALEPFLATGAELGAKYIVTAPYDPDHSRLTENLGRFGELASKYGSRPVLEFFPWTSIANLHSALDVAKASDGSGAGILIDTLHFNRSGSDPADLAKDNWDRFPFIHLCDAMVRPAYTEAELLHTARGERLAPGLGQIPLTEILGKLPTDIPVALEIPMDTLQRKIGSAGVAKMIFTQTQKYFQDFENQVGIAIRDE